jgi:hypothetical protein
MTVGQINSAPVGNEVIQFGLDSCLSQPAKSLIAVVTWYSISHSRPKITLMQPRGADVPV